VLAQDATGRITGVIYDPTGAVIADAQIIVTHVAIHISRKTTSDSSGFYQVLALPIGYYTVSVTHTLIQLMRMPAAEPALPGS